MKTLHNFDSDSSIVHFLCSGADPRKEIMYQTLKKHIPEKPKTIIRYYLRKLNYLKKIVLMPNWKLRYLSDEAYGTDGFITIHDVPFLRDKQFINAYDSSVRDIESIYLKRNSRFHKGFWERRDEIAWRSHITCWAATQVNDLEGDFVECGVANGILSRAICEYTQFQKQTRKFYLIDCWKPLNGTEHEEKYPGDVGGALYWYEFAKSRFAKYPNVQLVKGMIPEVLPALDHVKKVAYLSIDMNNGDPELAALEFFWDRLVVGAIVYFDDFLWGYPLLQKNIFEFTKRNKVELLHIPTGNSILIKK